MTTNLRSQPSTVRPHRSRDLGTFERAQLLTSRTAAFNLVLCLRIDATVDHNRLRQALDVLQSRHPALTARVRRRSSTLVFELGAAPPIPLTIFERSRAASWTEVTETELATGFDDAAGPLMRANLIEEAGAKDSTVIVTSFHHVIVDADSAGRIVEDLLELCGSDAALERGRAEPPVELPPAADDLFPRRHRGLSALWPSCRFFAREMLGEVGYRWRTRKHRRRPRYLADTGEPARCRVAIFRMSEADTRALVRATRRRRLTLNSALNAAILLAVVRHRYRGTDLPHRYFVFPTLRPYLEPAVAAGQDGSYLTTMRLTVHASQGRDVWSLASEIQGQVHEAERQGGRYLASRFSELSMKTVLRQSSCRMGTIGMSYTGAQPLAQRPGALRLLELHAFVSNLPVGPEFTAQARILHDRLWLDVVYLDGDMDRGEAEAIAGEALALLSDGGESTAPDRPGGVP